METCTYVPDSCPIRRACFLKNESSSYYGTIFQEANASSLCLCMPPYTGDNCDEFTSIQQGVFGVAIVAVIFSIFISFYGIIQGYRRFRNKPAARSITFALIASIIATILSSCVGVILMFAWTNPELSSTYAFGLIRGLRVEYGQSARVYMSAIIGGLTVVATLLICGTWYDVAMLTKRLRQKNHSKLIQKVSSLSALVVMIVFIVFVAIGELSWAYGFAAAVSALLGILMAIGGLLLAHELHLRTRSSDSDYSKAIDRAAKRATNTVLVCSTGLILTAVFAPLGLTTYWPSRGAPPVELTPVLMSGYIIFWAALMVNTTIIMYVTNAPSLSDPSQNNRASKRFASKEEDSSKASNHTIPVVPSPKNANPPPQATGFMVIAPWASNDDDNAGADGAQDAA